MDTHHGKPDMVLALMSIVFIIPIIFTVYNRQWLGASACVFVLVASILNHSTKIFELWVLDQMACLYIIAVSFYYTIHYRLFYITLPLLLYVLLVYHFGYITRTMAWCEKPAESRLWHSSMHVFTALAATYISYAVAKV